MLQTMVHENATLLFVISAPNPSLYGPEAEKTTELAQGLLNKMKQALTVSTP